MVFDQSHVPRGIATCDGGNRGGGEPGRQRQTKESAPTAAATAKGAWVQKFALGATHGHVTSYTFADRPTHGPEPRAVPDMPVITFSVDSVTAKARPRVLRSGRSYSPAKTVRAEEAVRDAYRRTCAEAYGHPCMAGAHVPVHITIRTARPLPKSRPKSVESEPDTYKPDWDNLGKLVCDALNGVAYADDAQVTRAVVDKGPRKRGQGELTLVTISWGEEIVLLGGTEESL